MPRISQAVGEHTVGRDKFDGFRLEVVKLEVYLKQLILRLSIRITRLLVFSLLRNVAWNFIAPTSKDVSD